jgi:lipopolysaccharide export system permease protein
LRLRIPILDRYLLAIYIKPFFATFLVMVFFLLMQLLWKYVDDLAGRGVAWYYIAELMFYWSAAVVPMALPLAVLLSSLMTFGSLGEQNELAAFKSGGISLYRIMRPLVVFLTSVAFGSFLFYNYVIPVANLKGENLLINISRQKPALNIRQGIFYAGIEGYSIKIGEKYGPDNSYLRNILIYDHRDKLGNIKVTAANEGKMTLTPDERFLVFTLYDGKSYEDQQPAKRQDRDRMPFVVNAFDSATIRFNLDDFQTGNLREEHRRDYSMLNVVQLMEAADTLEILFEERRVGFTGLLKEKYLYQQHNHDTTVLQDSLIPSSLIDHMTPQMKLRVIQNALRIARLNKEHLAAVHIEYAWRDKVIARHFIEWHKKFSVSVIVLLLFFIGAPLGAVIRKGGIGVPVVVSVLVFIVYHVLNISFEKMGRELVMLPHAGIWTPTFILLPFACFLTIQAANDSKLLKTEFYRKVFSALFAHIKRLVKPKAA